MEQRAPFISPSGVEYIDAIEGINKPAVIALPIISTRDTAGSIILLKDGIFQRSNEAAIKILSVAASFFLQSARKLKIADRKNLSAEIMFIIREE